MVNNTKKILSECNESSDWQKCYGLEIAKSVINGDPKMAVNTLDRIQESDQKTLGCHLIAHYIARASVEKYRMWHDDILKEGTKCNFGYIHGSLEALSAFDQRYTINHKTIPTICEEISEINFNDNIHDGCAHIMGHLILTQQYSENLEVSLLKTLEECRMTTEEYRHSCYSGAIMESLTRDNLQEHWGLAKIKWWEENEIIKQEKVCFSLDEEFKRACWEQMAHLYVTGYNTPPKVYTACSRSGDFEKTIYCYVHAVSSLAMLGPSEKSYLESICAPYENHESGYFSCARGVISPLLTSSSKYAEKAVAFCSAQKAGYKDVCFEILIKELERIPKEETSNSCALLPLEYKSGCKNT